MMRKVSLVLAGAIVGAGLTGLATQTRLLSSSSAVAASMPGMASGGGRSASRGRACAGPIAPRAAYRRRSNSG